MPTLLIGIDDTDNLESRGTGFHARGLVDRLHARELVQAFGVTRHQLFVDDRVPYTSHNSSACIAVETEAEFSRVQEICRVFLLEIAAQGSDVGLCLATPEQAHSVIEFGMRAKSEVISQYEARELAEHRDILLQGLTGDHQGIIGALSAVGLFAQGDDGRYIWLPEIRDRAETAMSVAELRKIARVDKVALRDGRILADDDAVIDLGAWPRAVRMGGQAVLLVESFDGNAYRVLDQDSIKSIRP